MKKFGTPSGAGPGSAKENVGLAGVGTPFRVVGAGGLAFFVAATVESVCVMAVPTVFFVPLFWLPLDLVEGREPFCLVLDVLLGVVVVDWGVVEVGVVVVDDGEVVVALTEGVVEVVGVHDAVTLFTGPVPGGTSAEAGVPGGTLTWNVNTWPLSNVTVTVH